MLEEKKWPKVATAAYIFNNAGKVFLMRGPLKFGNQYFIPGGHIGWGESAEQCIVREVQEETGLAIHDVTFFRPAEFIFYELYSKEKHFVSLGFLAKTDAAESDVVLDGREATEYAWLTPEEIVMRDDVESQTKLGMAQYIEQSKNKSSEEYKIGWQRAVADYQNLQREVAARRQEWVAMSEQQILEEFIPVYDNFKKAFAHHPELADGDETHKKIKQWISGIGHIQRQFSDILKAHKVEEIKTVGEQFDPKFHESVGEAHEPELASSVQGKVAPGTIVKEVDGGYSMGGRVIKVAKVLIVRSA